NKVLKKVWPFRGGEKQRQPAQAAPSPASPQPAAAALPEQKKEQANQPAPAPSAAPTDTTDQAEKLEKEITEGEMSHTLEKAQNELSEIKKEITSTRV